MNPIQKTYNNFLEIIGRRETPTEYPLSLHSMLSYATPKNVEENYPKYKNQTSHIARINNVQEKNNQTVVETSHVDTPDDLSLPVKRIRSKSKNFQEIEESNTVISKHKTSPVDESEIPIRRRKREIEQPKLNEMCNDIQLVMENG